MCFLVTAQVRLAANKGLCLYRNGRKRSRQQQEADKARRRGTWLTRGRREMGGRVYTEAVRPSSGDST